MMRNLPHMMRLEQIAIEKNSPVFARAHIKQENVWYKQYEISKNSKIDEDVLKNYPSPADTVTKWKEGMKVAQEMASVLGMGPEDIARPPRRQNKDCSDDQKWFYSPHRSMDRNDED